MNRFRPSPHAGATRRRALGIFGAGLAALAAVPVPAFAQAPHFPSRVVRIVPFGSPGGPMDVIARIYAEKLKTRWNQPVIVEARPGASGTIAADAVAKAQPDGYTVLLTLPLTHINNVVLQPRLPYDPVKDFEPLSQLATGGPMLIARASAPFSNVREFVAYAKAHPGVSYGTWGNGSNAHLFGELLARQAGIDLVHVPYKAEAAAHNDMFGEALGVAWANPSTARALAQSGRIKVLGITGPAARALHAQRADLHRAGLSRLRPRQLDRRLCASEDPAAGARRMVRGAARDHEDARCPGAPGRLRLRAAGQHARRVPGQLQGRLSPRRGPHQGRRSHTRMSTVAPPSPSPSASPSPATATPSGEWQPIAFDTGTAYGARPPSHKPELTEVGAGTPMGELLRRYWHPIGLAADATDTPRQVRVLGEDLILFRDKAGRPGLVHWRCAHRGASLYYGRVEEEGIRCCYHGWMFDVQGHCVDQPCEADGGARTRGRVRQPWYPVQEQYGLVWAYLGPAEKKPVLPRYDCLETMDEGETLEADDNSIGGGGPQVIPCNWLQHYENVADPFHVPVLHGSFSGTQFVALMGQMPDVSFESTETGVTITSIRKLEDGGTFRRVAGPVLPTLRVVPNPRVAAYGRVESIGWVLPIDDHSFRIYTVGRVKTPGDLARVRSRLNGKLWEELSEAEHRAFPGDYEAQVSQGKITAHSEEHLASSDRGIVMLRRLLQRQLDAVREGRDPAGVSFDPAAAPVHFEAGNFLVRE
jgi:tripartite-type tricarboxylate transporter receptor subunit TctC/nitrite reductase/ring-hydroxylating ferredoxin subunit